jgi:hypothetical protein
MTQLLQLKACRKKTCWQASYVAVFYNYTWLQYDNIFIMKC